MELSNERDHQPTYEYKRYQQLHGISTFGHHVEIAHYLHAVSTRTITWKFLVNFLGKLLTILNPNCAGEGVPFPLHTRKLQGTRQRPTIKYTTTKCKPRLTLYTRIKFSNPLNFPAFSRVVRSIITCRNGLRPQVRSDRISLIIRLRVARITHVG